MGRVCSFAAAAWSELSELGWYRAATLAPGPQAVLSHVGASGPCEAGRRHADLAPFELYRALEEAESRYAISLPLNDVVRLKQAVRGYTRSDAEAQFLILCQQDGITLPLVNHHLNGIETDFHWPQARLVLGALQTTG